MKLKQIALLVTGFLPFAVIAQTNTPHIVVSQGSPQISNRPGNIVVPSKPPMNAEMPEKGKLSYAIGMYFGSNITNSIKRGDLAVDMNAVLDAITSVVNGKPTKMTEKEVGDVLNQLRGAMQSRKQHEDEQSKAKSDAFLAAFAKSPGVITLPEGIEYKVIKDGTGPKPQPNDSVTMAYRGSFTDGTEFDHNDSFPTSLRGGVIPGWLKVLPLMKVGSKWHVVIPSAMGYGPRGRPPKIPANAVLIFDMELKSITPGMPTPQPTAAAPAPAPGAPSTTTPVVSGEIIKVPSADELKKGAKIEVIKGGQTNAVNAQ